MRLVMKVLLVHLLASSSQPAPLLIRTKMPLPICRDENMEFVRESSKELHAAHPPRSARLACSSSLTGETHFGVGFEILEIISWNEVNERELWFCEICKVTFSKLNPTEQQKIYWIYMNHLHKYMWFWSFYLATNGSIGLAEQGPLQAQRWFSKLELTLNQTWSLVSCVSN